MTQKRLFLNEQPLFERLYCGDHHCHTVAITTLSTISTAKARLITRMAICLTSFLCLERLDT